MRQTHTLAQSIISCISHRATPVQHLSAFSYTKRFLSVSTPFFTTISTATDMAIQPAPTPTKTIVVLGSAYGGCRASKIVSDNLPRGYRLVVIDRNTHFNHVYAFPRYTVISEHAPKGYIPRTHDLDVPEDVAKAEAAADFLDLQKAAGAPPTPPKTPEPSLNGNSSIGCRVPPNPTPNAPFFLPKRREFIHASVVRLDAHSVTFTRPGQCDGDVCPAEGAAITGPSGHFDGPEETLEFDYCIYALGAALPDPCNPWSEHPNIPPEITENRKEWGLGSKRWGVKWMQQRAETFKKANRILIVGGGALGIEFASDLKDVYPDKEITMLHSRTRLLPIYPEQLHHEIIKGLNQLGVKVVLGERVTEWPINPEKLDGVEKKVVTDKDNTYTADIVLPCTGQKAHSQYMAELCPDAISPINKRIRVLPTLQVSTDPSTERYLLERLADLNLQTPPSPPSSNGSTNGGEKMDLSHIFAIGDCADTGAIQAGHTAYYMGEVAARNLVRLISHKEGFKNKELGDELESYKYGKPAIKVTLGLVDAVISNAEGTTPNSDGKVDMSSRVIWNSHNAGHLPDDA